MELNPLLDIFTDSFIVSLAFINRKECYFFNNSLLFFLHSFPRILQFFYSCFALSVVYFSQTPLRLFYFSHRRSIPMRLFFKVVALVALVCAVVAVVAQCPCKKEYVHLNTDDLY